MSQQQQAADVTLSLWDQAAYFFVDGDLPEHVADAIDDELSYEVPDHQYTDAWQEGEWDGHEHLFRESQNGNWFFPVGCLEHVTRILDMYSVDYGVEGLVRPGRGDLDLGWNTDMTLRDYQQEAVDEALAYGNGVIVLPTGAGKTLIGLYLAHTVSRSTLVLVHRQEIADQWVEQIDDILGYEPAVYYGGTRETGDVQVALYQSIYDDGEIRDDARLDHDVALFDEVHRVGADTFSTVAMEASAPYRWGFSATPEREDNATLKVIGGTGPMIADLSAETLIEQGYLAKPEWSIFEAPTSEGRSAYRQWQAEYKGEIVENEERNELIANVTGDLRRPTLLTVERISHGERLESLIPDSEFIHGDASDREENIQAFRDGDLDVLIATRGIVGEGFDVPEIRSFAVAGGLKSSTSMIQQVGRALRPSGEENTATIVDFVDRGEWVGDHSEERIRTYQDYYGEFAP